MWQLTLTNKFLHVLNFNILDVFVIVSSLINVNKWNLIVQCYQKSTDF